MLLTVALTTYYKKEILAKMTELKSVELNIVTDGKSILRMTVVDDDINPEQVAERIHSYLCTPVNYRRLPRGYAFYTPDKICEMEAGPQDLQSDRKCLENSLSLVGKFHVSWKIDYETIKTQHLKKLIIRRRQDCINRQKSLCANLTELYKLLSSPDENYQGSLQENINTTHNVLREVEQQLHKYDATIARIAQGTFGICAICEKSISIRRLEAIPETTCCIKCAT